VLVGESHHLHGQSDALEVGVSEGVEVSVLLLDPGHGVDWLGDCDDVGPVVAVAGSEVSGDTIEHHFVGHNIHL